MKALMFLAEDNAQILKTAIGYRNNGTANGKIVLLTAYFMAKYKEGGEGNRGGDSREIREEGFLKKAGKFEVAVTPIFTLGGAAFSKFERDEETKKVKLNEKFGTPEKAIYCFPKMEVKGPEPRYCEQPMVYLLAYLLQLAGDIKENTYQRSNFLSKLVIILQQKLGESISAMDYEEQRSVILEKLKRNGDGYRIIQNPMKF